MGVSEYIESVKSSKRKKVQIGLWILGLITFIVYLGVVSNKVATANNGRRYFLLNFESENRTVQSLPAWVFYTIHGGTFGPNPANYPTCNACCRNMCVAVPSLNITATVPSANWTDISFAYNWINQLGLVEYHGNRDCPRIECTFPIGTDHFAVTVYDQGIPVNKIRFGGPEEFLPSGWFDVRFDPGYGGWVLWRKEVYHFMDDDDHDTPNSDGYGSVGYSAMGTTSAPVTQNTNPTVTMIPGTGFTTVYNEVVESSNYDGSIFLGNLGGFLLLIILGYYITLVILETIMPSLKDDKPAYQVLQ